MARKKLMLIGSLTIGVVLAVVATATLRPRRLEGPELLRHPGLQWLSWSGSERENYVLGYVDGYGVGASDACLAADRLFDVDKPRIFGHDDVPSTFPSARCNASVPGYTDLKRSLSTGPELGAYTTPITEFYTKHQSQRDISYLVLLGMLKGGEKLTGEDLYGRIVNGRPTRR